MELVLSCLVGTLDLTVAGSQINEQLGENCPLCPSQLENVVSRVTHYAPPPECRVSITHANQLEQMHDYGPRQSSVDFRGRVVVAIDVATDFRALKQLHVI